MKEKRKTAEKIRSFNRFFLPRFHLLTQKYLNSDYSVAEARIIYEIYAEPGINARDIVSRLQVDKGYLSRLLKKLETRSIILRTNTSEDSRLVSISLTNEGNALAEELINLSNQQVEEDLEGLSPEELKELSGHFDSIIRILGGYDSGNR